jgi:uncharacterized protein YndB with AHSA1/START domain
MSSEGGVIEREVFVDAPPKLVFEFLVDAQLMARWIGSFQQIDPQPGGIFQVEVSPGNIARGQYTEVVPFRRVAFTWGWSSQDPELAVLRPGTSLVEIELEPKSGGTLLRLHQPSAQRTRTDSCRALVRISRAARSRHQGSHMSSEIALNTNRRR